jgi:RNA polymerase sigma-70 factor (ECF subfamily)
MSLPERNIVKTEMRTPAVSINFPKLDETQLVSYFHKPIYTEDAFRELLRRFQAKIYAYVRNMLISREDADDVTQLVFIKVWQNLSSFRGESKLNTWIYRIASNETISFLRKKRPEIDFDEAQMFMVETLQQDDAISEREIEAKLQKALCYLPFKQKLVFVLRYFEDLSYEDIAELTQTSVGALKSSYHHAVKKIEIYLGVL